MINTMHLTRKWIEDNSRSKFNNQRSQLQRNIGNSHQNVFQRNRSQVNSIKEERKRLDNIVNTNKKNGIEMNKMQYQKVKNESMRAKSVFRNQMDNYFNSTTGMYQSRIEEKHYRTSGLTE